jgi:hypothetical protein
MRWLAEPAYHSAPICLTFVRGAGEDAVRAGFGTDPAGDVAAGDRASWQVAQPTVRIGRSGDWLVAIEENIPPQGTRPEVLRRVSEGAEVVSLYQDIGKGNDEFGHAVGGDVVASVMTTIPEHWQGSNPGPLQARAQALRDDDGERSDWMILLALAEESFGLSLDEEDLRRPWPATRILPPLADLPRPPTAPTAPTARPGFDDPVINVLLTHADDAVLRNVASARIGRLLEETGLAGQVELTSAARRLGTEAPVQVRDDDPLGLTLRRLALDAELATFDRAVGPNFQGYSESLTRDRIRLGHVVGAIRSALAGRYLRTVIIDLSDQRTRHPDSWREQALADLATVRAPEQELEEAERTWQATKHLPAPVGMIDTAPVREHVRRLLDSGMEASRVAELAGLTLGGLDNLLSGRMRRMHGLHARRMLTIEPPER